MRGKKHNKAWTTRARTGRLLGHGDIKCAADAREIRHRLKEVRDDASKIRYTPRIYLRIERRHLLFLLFRF